ncbi:hypothetical protein ACNO65_16310 [Vibrio campbellii]|uniref:hypothetical protein n=1 Tax=Vibrio campbellii TaxID=680 RepID=UPI003AABAB6F
MTQAMVKDKKLASALKEKHQILYLLSAEQLADLHDQMNLANARSGAGYASSILDFKTLSQMARDLGIKGRIFEKVIAGDKYVLFNGKLGFKSIFTKTASNTQVVDMALGKASAIASSVRSGARLTIFLSVPIIILQHILKDRVLLTDLVADLSITIVKVGVSSIVAAVAATIVGTVTTIAAAPLAVAIFVGLAVGYSLDKLDEALSITDKMSLILSEIEDATLGEFSRGLWELERTLRWQIMNSPTPGKGIFYP